MENIIKIFVKLLDEGGTEVFRPTHAVEVSNGNYKLLPCEDYDPTDEIWEFLPGDIVKGELAKDEDGKDFLIASEKSE